MYPSANGNAAKPVFGKKREPHTIIIAHGDEVSHFVVKPWLTFSIGAVCAAIAVGYVLATSYLVFRDDLIGAAISRQARMQQAYEDRIGALRAQVDRITSRQLLDQQIMETKVAELIDRQEQLSVRGGRLGPLLERAKSNQGDVPIPAAKPGNQVLGSVARESGFIGRIFNSNMRRDSVSEADRADALFATITRSIHDIESNQMAEVSQLADGAEATVKNIKLALATGGLTLAEDVKDVAEGGPYIPASEGEAISAFDIEVNRLDLALTRLDSAKTQISRHPVSNPVPGAETTSRFGYRTDPLIGSQAFHAGIDFRGDIGHPVRSAASGTVITAGRQGGYGNFVEIQHKDGLTTRFGHLNSIAVKVGQSVGAGDIIGAIGNTGRSTGPHLHYEIRLNGKPLDPARYLGIGRKIEKLL